MNGPNEEKGGFETAAIVEPDGSRRSLTRSQYEDMELSHRIQLLMDRRVEFYRGHMPVPYRLAFKA